MSEEEAQQAQPIAGIGTMVFNKWDAQQVVCGDPGLAPYINLTTIGTPHSGGRHANAWFGKSFASEQHFQMSRMRAIETGRYLLRATNTGVTAIVGPNGNVQRRAEPFKYSLLLGTYEPMIGTTPYIKYGNSLIVILMILSLFLGYSLIRNRQSYR